MLWLHDFLYLAFLYLLVTAIYSLYISTSCFRAGGEIDGNSNLIEFPFKGVDGHSIRDGLKGPGGCELSAILPVANMGYLLVPEASPVKMPARAEQGVHRLATGTGVG